MKIKIFVTKCLFILFVSIFAYNQAHAMEVRGQQVRWTMQTTGEWVGGSFYDLQRVVEGTPEGKMRKIYEILRDHSKKIDAYLMHYNDMLDLANQKGAGLTSKTLTSIHVVAVHTGVHRQYDNDSEFWKDVMIKSDVLEQDKSKGINTSFQYFQRYKLDGFNAYEGIFKSVMPNSGVRYTVLVYVSLKNHIHSFILKTDSSRYNSRYDELHTMLKTLKYR